VLQELVIKLQLASNLGYLFFWNKFQVPNFWTKRL